MSTYKTSKGRNTSDCSSMVRTGDWRGEDRGPLVMGINRSSVVPFRAPEYLFTGEAGCLTSSRHPTNVFEHDRRRLAERLDQVSLLGALGKVNQHDLIQLPIRRNVGSCNDWQGKICKTVGLGAFVTMREAVCSGAPL